MVLLPEGGFLIFSKPHRNLSVPKSTLCCSNLGMGNLKEVCLAHGSDGRGFRQYASGVLVTVS